MNRRDFTTNVLNYAFLGTGVIGYLSPTISELEAVVSNPYTIEAYKEMFQQEARKHKYAAAALKVLGLNNSQLSASDQQQINISVHDRGNLKPVALAQTTPKTLYKNKPGAGKNGALAHTNLGHIAHVQNGPDKGKEFGIFRGKTYVKKTPSGYEHRPYVTNYVVHHSFVKYTQLKDYFCYGQPCSNYITYYCDDCGLSYSNQKFYYEGDTIYERDLSSFWHQGSCPAENRTSDYGTSIHKVVKTEDPVLFDTLQNLSLVPIEPCVCDDNHKSTSRSIASNR